MLGVHVSRASKVLDDKKDSPLDHAITRDCETLQLNSVQIFTHGPQYITKNKYDVNAVAKVCSSYNTTVHAPYGSSMMWNTSDDTTTANKFEKYLESQLSACKEIDAWGVVIHCNRNTPSHVAAVCKKYKPYFIKHGIVLLLEMPASRAHPEYTYETPEKINRVNALLGRSNYYAWCIDTAHLWGAGVDCSRYSTMKKWLEKIADKSRIQQFHLNGSSSNLGSGADKHEIAFSSVDKIYNGIPWEDSGVRAVCEFAKKHNAVVICEINRGTESEVKKLMKLLKAALY